MKTTDGQEAVIGRCYYNEIGEQLMLDDCVANSQGNVKYLVTPIYEGDAMEVYCVGEHMERTILYEHHGEQRIENAIFAEEPMKKLGEKTKKAVDELHYLALAVGELAKIKESLQQETNKLSLKKTSEEKRFETVLKTVKNAEESVVNVNAEISKKRKELSELEDKMSAVREGEYAVHVSPQELSLLRKQSFKLQCLEAGGVDSWEWYNESMGKYLERYGG